MTLPILSSTKKRVIQHAFVMKNQPQESATHAPIQATMASSPKSVCGHFNSSQPQQRSTLWSVLSVVLLGLLVVQNTEIMGLFLRLIHQGQACLTPVWRAPMDAEGRYQRFDGWPWRAVPRVGDPLPAGVQQSLGWDDRGLSYAVLDANHVLLSHEEASVGTVLNFWTGQKVIQRNIATDVEVRLLPQAKEGLHVARLDSPLPIEVRPLPIFPFPNQIPTGYLHHIVVPFARGGAYGAQRIAGLAPHSKPYPDLVLLVAEVAMDHPAGICLNAGDSGGALLLKDQDTWYLLGSAHSVSLTDEGNFPTFNGPSAEKTAYGCYYYLATFIHDLREKGVRVATFHPGDEASLPLTQLTHHHPSTGLKREP
jgi:hypothetical protein